MMTSSTCPAVYAALWLPRFQLQAACRGSQSMSRQAPRAVLDSEMTASTAEVERSGRVLHACQAAEKAGVMPGMTASQARARCGTLHLMLRAPEEEARAQGDLLRCAAHWTPHYESTSPGLCVMEVSRVKKMRGRLEACGANMRQMLAQCGLQAHAGFADSVDMACLAARAASTVLVLDGKEHGPSLLHHLPLSVLHPPADTGEILRLWGIRTLADLAALPRQEISTRLGMQGVLLWDMATGRRERLLRMARPGDPYRETMELEYPLDSLEPLLFLLRRMLDALCTRLAESWLVASAERLRLQFENAEIHERCVQMAEPTRNAELLLRVLHTHLDGLTAASPVRIITLELMPATPDGRQCQLFERGLRNPNRFAETLAQLEALLGAGYVGRPVLLPSRRCNAFVLENQVHPPDLPSKGTPPGPDADGGTHGLPLRWLRPSRRITVLLRDGVPAVMHTPQGPLDILQTNAPCLLSGDWWDGLAWQREIWEVAASDGGLYQIAREKNGWVLDGIFG